MKSKDQCAGVNVSGYWRGCRCGNEGKFKAPDGKLYCHAHYAIAVKTPERFKKIVEAMNE